MPRRPPRPSVAAALALSAVLTGGVSVAQAAAPAAVFLSDLCDLGSVVQGERPECVFSFTNAGGEDLRILGVEPSCGCTSALPGPALLRSGERGVIRVLFDSESFAGEVVKEIDVRSNDPARPVRTLRLRALVEPEVEFEPRTVSFVAAGDASDARQTVVLTNRRSEPVRIVALRAEPSSFRCVMPAWAETSRPLVLESWDRTVLEAIFTPWQPLVMPVAGECVLEIDGPRKRYFRLKLLALPAR